MQKQGKGSASDYLCLFTFGEIDIYMSSLTFPSHCGMVSSLTWILNHVVLSIYLSNHVELMRRTLRERKVTGIQLR